MSSEFHPPEAKASKCSLLLFSLLDQSRVGKRHFASVGSYRAEPRVIDGKDNWKKNCSGGRKGVEIPLRTFLKSLAEKSAILEKDPNDPLTR